MTQRQRSPTKMSTADTRQPPANGGSTSTVRRPAAAPHGRARRGRRPGNCAACRTAASRSPCRCGQHADQLVEASAGRHAAPRRCRRPPGRRRSTAPVSITLSRRSPTSAGPAAGTSGRRCRARRACPTSRSASAAASSSSSAPPRSAPRRSVSSVANRQLRICAVGGQPGAVAVAAERPGHAADHADPGRPPSRRVAVDQPGLGRRAAALGRVGQQGRTSARSAARISVGGDHRRRGPRRAGRPAASAR